MLNWPQLSFQQRLLGAVFLCYIFGALYAVCFPDQPRARLPQAGLPLLMLGFLLHPRCFAGGRGAFSWSSAPRLVKGLWVIGIMVGSISAVDSLLAAMTGR